jgi:Predicted transcriptional regulators
MTVFPASTSRFSSTSALRHYESWGIVPTPERTASGYRLYTEEHAAYFECFRAMRPGFGMDIVKKTMTIGEASNETGVPGSAILKDSLAYLNYRIRQQTRGVYYLYRLCKTVGLL